MPPDTQASCSTVSERPNAEARERSGRSRCTTASSATLASALHVAATSAVTAAVPMPGRNAANGRGGGRDADDGQDQRVGVVEPLA